MPVQLQNSDGSDTTAATVWPYEMKDKTNQGVGFTKATQKIVKKNMDSEPFVVPKKTCVCAPTSHAGSFRCRLHRTGPTQKSSWSVEESSGTNSWLKFNCKNMNMQRSMVDGHPRLSRFGRAAAAAAGAPHDD
ncbi:hypothetical protein L1049_005260 [Liquidambar formosana]|uniref:Uncharacterized protein n=1 Tax=Liquidambar formosana TaxID=63359 RepID=A0AAP0RQX7_LIQFO